MGQSNLSVSKALRAIPIVTSLLATVGGSISLLGWVADAPRLSDWEGSGITIKANAAILLICCGIAMFLASLKPDLRMVIRFLGGLAALIGGITLVQHATGVNFGIDTLFFQEAPGAPATASPGRMGVPASASFVLIGSGLIFATLSSRFRRMVSLCGAATFGITLLALVGYLYGANQLYAVASLSGIALQTAFMLWLLAVGLTVLVPDCGIAAALERRDAGGVALRRLILPMILVPVIIGWLRLVGQRAGYYDVAFGAALRTLAEIALLAALVWWTCAGLSNASSKAEDVRLSLLESEERYKALAENLPGSAVFVVNHDLRYVLAQGDALRTVGFQPADFEGKTVREVIPESLVPEYERLYRQVLNGDSFAWEHQSHGRDFISHGTPLFTATGETYAALAVSFDITERRIAEQALRKSEERLRMALRATRMVSWEWDPRNDKVTISDGMHEIYGTSEIASAAEGFSLVREEDRPAHMAKIAQVTQEGGQYMSEFRIRRPDNGETAWLEERGKAVLDPEGFVAYVVGVTLDVTSRKEAEEELAAAYRLQKAIFDTSPDLIYVKDVEGRLVAANPKTVEIIGQPLEVLVGRNEIEWGGDTPETRAIRANDQSVIRSGGTHFWEEEYTSPDGTTRIFQSAKTCWLNGDGTPRGIIGISRDISELKRTQQLLSEREAQLGALNTQLEVLIQERTADLVASNDQLQGFTYAVAHDLRQQIRGISVNAALLLNDTMTTLGADEQGHLRELIQASRQLSALVDDLLKHAKLGRAEPQRSEFDFTELVKETGDALLRNAHPQASIDVQPGMILDADRSMIGIAVQNLLENGLKYARPGQAPQISVGCADGVYHVKDNGIGFDMAYAHRLFEPFERLHRETSYSGTGIGLANVKRIIEKHGGGVWAEAEPGVGATFYFTLG